MNVSDVLQKIQLKSPRRKGSQTEGENSNNGSRNVSDMFQKMKFMSPQKRSSKDYENDSNASTNNTTSDRSSGCERVSQNSDIEMLKVTVSISKLNGIVSDCNVKKPGMGIGGQMNPFRSSTPSNANANNNNINGSFDGIDDGPDNEFTFAVISLAHDALGCAEPVVTRFSSQPLERPSSTFGTKSKYVARWSTRLKNAANNASVKPSITFPKMMEVAQPSSTFKYNPDFIEFSVGLIRKNEMITLGTAKLVVSESTDEEIKMRLPLIRPPKQSSNVVNMRNPVVIQNIIDKVKNRKKKKILVNLYEKGKHMRLVKDMSNGVFESRPSHKFTIEDEASLEITLKVSPVDIQPIVQSNDGNEDNEDDDFTIITAYNNPTKTFPYEEYVIKFTGGPETPSPDRIALHKPDPTTTPTKCEEKTARREGGADVRTTPLTTPLMVENGDNTLYSFLGCCFGDSSPPSPIRNVSPDYKVQDRSFDLGHKRDSPTLWEHIVGSFDERDEWNRVDDSFTAVSDFKDVTPRRVKTARRGNGLMQHKDSATTLDDDISRDIYSFASTRDTWMDDCFTEEGEYDTIDDTTYSSDYDTYDDRTFETGLTALSTMSEYSLGPNTMYSVVHAKKILREYSKMVGKDPKNVVKYRA